MGYRKPHGNPYFIDSQVVSFAARYIINKGNVMKTDPKSYILHLTVEEFIEVLKENLPALEVQAQPQPAAAVEAKEGPTFTGRLVYGIKGIADLFDVCNKTASEWKKSWLKPAIKQEGRKIMTDVEYALKLYGQKRPQQPQA